MILMSQIIFICFNFIIKDKTGIFSIDTKYVPVFCFVRIYVKRRTSLKSLSYMERVLTYSTITTYIVIHDFKKSPKMHGPFGKGLINLIIHVIQPGDSVYAIAKKYGVPVQQIIEDNNLENINQLVPGQALVVMTKDIRHTVLPGQTLYSIARQYGTTVVALLEANPDVIDPARIFAGQIIMIPASKQKLGVIDVNGYALPDISNGVLARTLPHLTFLSPFSYQVKPDGGLIPMVDGPMTQAARQENVASLLVITNTREGAGFDSRLAHIILTDEQAQDALIKNTIATLREKNYYGLNIDFEYIYPYDRESYNQFLRKITEMLHSLGYIVSTALAPKITGDQRGLLYEAHDYAAQGAIVDYIILMTYEWGYTFGPAQAVAPADKVEQVLQYAVSVIPSKKILMGMPNYGYDWTLPFVRGSAAQSLNNTAAINLAGKVGARIHYDPKAQAPFFNYYDENGRQHIVWFDDARSIEARLALVNKYQLAGVSYWTINSYFPQNWLVLDTMYDVGKVL